MKAAAFLFLLTVCSVVMRAQTSAARSADVTIKISTGSPEYCLGEILQAPFFLPSTRLEGPQRGPDDITLRLPFNLLYENHRSETIIVPSWIHYLTRMTVDGQNGSTVLRKVGNGGMDVKTVMAISSPAPRFSIIAGGKDAWSTGL